MQFKPQNAKAEKRSVRAIREEAERRETDARRNADQCGVTSDHELEKARNAAGPAQTHWSKAYRRVERVEEPVKTLEQLRREAFERDVADGHYPDVSYETFWNSRGPISGTYRTEVCRSHGIGCRGRQSVELAPKTPAPVVKAPPPDVKIWFAPKQEETAAPPRKRRLSALELAMIAGALSCVPLPEPVPHDPR